MHFLLTLLSRFISRWDLSKGLESFINASNVAHLTAMVRRDEALHFHQILKWRLYIKYSLILFSRSLWKVICICQRSEHSSSWVLLPTLNNTAILLCVPGPPVKLNTLPAAHENPGTMTREELCVWSYLFVPFSCCRD